jgi:hypothetical protein
MKFHHLILTLAALFMALTLNVKAQDNAEEIMK